MAWRPANSLATLRDQLNAAHPNRSKASDGMIGDAAHAATKSEHNPNSAGIVTAFDITHDPANGVDGTALADILINDSRTWYVIFNRRIWETGVGWQSYFGSDPHTSHVHISVKQVNTAYDNAAKWNISYNQGGANIMIEDNDSEYARWWKFVRRMWGDVNFNPAWFRKDFVGQNPKTIIDAIQNNPQADYRERCGDVGNLAIQGNWWEKISNPPKGYSNQEVDKAVKEATEAKVAADEALSAVVGLKN